MSSYAPSASGTGYSQDAPGMTSRQQQQIDLAQSRRRLVGSTASRASGGGILAKAGSTVEEQLAALLHFRGNDATAADAAAAAKAAAARTAERQVQRRVVQQWLEEGQGLRREVANRARELNEAWDATENALFDMSEAVVPKAAASGSIATATSSSAGAGSSSGGPAGLIRVNAAHGLRDARRMLHNCHEAATKDAAVVQTERDQTLRKVALVAAATSASLTSPQPRNRVVAQSRSRAEGGVDTYRPGTTSAEDASMANRHSALVSIHDAQRQEAAALTALAAEEAQLLQDLAHAEERLERTSYSEVGAGTTASNNTTASSDGLLFRTGAAGSSGLQVPPPPSLRPLLARWAASMVRAAQNIDAAVAASNAERATTFLTGVTEPASHQGSDDGAAQLAAVLIARVEERAALLDEGIERAHTAAVAASEFLSAVAPTSRVQERLLSLWVSTSGDLTQHQSRRERTIERAMVERLFTREDAPLSTTSATTATFAGMGAGATSASTSRPSSVVAPAISGRRAPSSANRTGGAANATAVAAPSSTAGSSRHGSAAPPSRAGAAAAVDALTAVLKAISELRARGVDAAAELRDLCMEAEDAVSAQRALLEAEADYAFATAAQQARTAEAKERAAALRAAHDVVAAERAEAEAAAMAARAEEQRVRDEEARAAAQVRAEAIAEWRAEKAATAAEEAKITEARLAEEAAAAAALAVVNAARVQARDAADTAKAKTRQAEREEADARRAAHEAALAQFFAATAERLGVERDPKRIVQPTTASASAVGSRAAAVTVGELAAAFDPYRNRGFTTEAIVSDARFKLAEALSRAGLHQTAYGRALLAGPAFAPGATARTGTSAAAAAAGRQRAFAVSAANPFGK
jgi:hypothetical protein